MSGGAIPVFISNYISGGNSTTTPLGSAGTFEGRPELTRHSDILSTVITDVAGTLFIDLSIDGGQNYDSTLTYNVAAGGGEFHTAVKGSRTVRVRYVNGSGAQSYLRMQIEFGQFGPPRAPLNRNIQNDADASIVRSIDSLVDIALGRFLGFEPVQKFGRAPTGVVSAAAGSDIWDLADSSTPTQAIWLPPTAARIHTLTSTSDEDTLTTGTGAWVMRVWYLADWDTAETFEDVNLNGTSGAAMSNAAVTINRMRVIANGGTSFPTGTITATAATDGTVTAVVRPNLGTTAMAIYGWPSTKTLLVFDWWASIMQAQAQARDVRCRLFRYLDPDNYPGLLNEVAVRGVQSNGDSSPSWPFPVPLALAGPGILKINGVGSASGLDVAAGFNGILVDN